MKCWLNAQKKNIKKAGTVAYAIARSFWIDDCYTKASTLTFYTLQSMVPFLAAVLAIAKGFGFDQYLEKVLTTTFAEQKEILNYAIEIALSMLKFISSGEIVGIGVILLLWTNINLVGYVELTLNEIWKVKISRSFFQKIKDFCFAVVVFPLILVASSSTTLYLKAQINQFSYFSTINQVFVHEIKIFLPWTLSCFLFGGLYFLIPNTPIRFWPRLFACIIAGTAFQLWQLIFINLQLYIFSYNVVYGAFALLPLFLIWLQFSWMIALAGAEISAYLENYRDYSEDLQNSEFTKISTSELALLILFECIATFYSGKPAYSLERLSEKIKVSQSLVEEILLMLEEENILVSFSNKEGEVCYHPLHDPSRLKILTVADLIQHHNEKEIVVETTPVVTRIRTVIDEISNSSEQSHANIPLSDFFRINAKDI